MGTEMHSIFVFLFFLFRDRRDFFRLVGDRALLGVLALPVKNSVYHGRKFARGGRGGSTRSDCLFAGGKRRSTECCDRESEYNKGERKRKSLLDFSTSNLLQWTGGSTLTTSSAEARQMLGEERGRVRMARGKRPHERERTCEGCFVYCWLAYEILPLRVHTNGLT